ncbi:MAG TPA: AbgT family transporter [Candidatus Enterocloster faecavium]|uniref:AbgT family transporter n=1 Tax=Candidatus Enterocloster faecavium TaxID=2838560 RepID=A0A9D2L7X9_9FIRM|nr:AbgT family transporter [Candidatus Enterocloster faecavium]
METAQERKTGGILGTIERVGNKLPHPFILFLYIIVILVAASAILAGMGVQVVNPTTQETVYVRNLLSRDGLVWLLENMIGNFSGFAPLGMVLAMQMAIGLAESVGLLSTVMRRAILGVPLWALSGTVMFLGINGSIASEASIIVVPALAATAFQAVGKHPLAGLIAGYAATNAGFTANVLITGTDALLCGVTEEAAHIIDPTATVSAASNWYFMIASTIILTFVGTFINDKVITPRLGQYKGGEQEQEREATGQEKRGLRNAGIFTLIFLVLLLVSVVPSNGILRGEDGSLLNSPFLAGIVPLLVIYFILVGIVYGKTVGTLKKASDVPVIMAQSLTSLTGYIVLVFVISQFIAMFNYTNLSMVIAVNGAAALQNAGFTGVPLLIGIVIMSAVVDLFMTSGSAKWYIFAPIFVPMLMLLGYSPAFAQAVYRIGDSIANPITPIYPYLPIVIGMAQKYDKNTGMGTIISMMLPYSMAFLVVWILQAVAWQVFNLPLGPDAMVFWP